MNAPEQTPKDTTEPNGETEALADVVSRVAQDARRRPEAYLEESLVPEGGE